METLLSVIIILVLLLSGIYWNLIKGLKKEIEELKEGMNVGVIFTICPKWDEIFEKFFGESTNQQQILEELKSKGLEIDVNNELQPSYSFLLLKNTPIWSYDYQTFISDVDLCFKLFEVKNNHFNAWKVLKEDKKKYPEILRTPLLIKRSYGKLEIGLEADYSSALGIGVHEISTEKLLCSFPLGDLFLMFQNIEKNYSASLLIKNFPEYIQKTLDKHKITYESENRDCDYEKDDKAKSRVESIEYFGKECLVKLYKDIHVDEHVFSSQYCDLRIQITTF